MARNRRIYEPLSKNEFRVLVLKPGRHDDPVRCKLKVHSLDEQPLIPFETISYVWGDPRAQRRIFLNGRAVHVPISTKQAIKRMRLPTEQRTLWIDAVCINQKDLDERSQQVTLMGRIYSCGIRNLIYLGNDPDNMAKTIFNGIDAATVKLSRAISFESYDEQEHWRDNRARPASWKTSPPVVEADVTPMEQLFERPWFTRLWVMQEACLAKKNLVCFGNMECDFGQSLDICIVAGSGSARWSWSREAKNGFDTSYWMHSIIESIPAGRKDSDVYDIFTLAKRLATKERHDRVFAVRDMLLMKCESHEIPNLLAVDYRKPIGAVFRDATLYALMTSRNDRILNEICHREEADMFTDGRTSWTAAWDQLPNDMQDSGVFSWDEKSAGLLSPDDEPYLGVRTAVAGGPLAVRSLVLAAPSEVEIPVCKFFWKDSDCLKSILTTVDALLVSTSVTSFITDEIAVDLLTGGWWYLDFGDLSQAAQALRGLRDLFRDDKLSSSPGSAIELHQDLREDIALHSSHRCFFAMTCGLVGSGPKIMRAGDRVAVAIGAHLPWIIRPSGRDDGSYYFIGTAYIPGLMKGEVFEMGLEEEVIKLR